MLGRTPTSAEKKAFIESAQERMIERSHDGISIRGTKFRQYSKEYAEAKGVNRNDVDMTKDGDMLLAIEGKDTSKNTVDMLIDDNLEAKKAFNHVTGDTLPKREFFGLNMKEAKTIANSVKQERPQQRTAAEFVDEEDDLLSALESLGLFAGEA